MARINRTIVFRFLLLTVLSSIAWAQSPVTDDTYIVSGSSTIQGANPSLQVASPSTSSLLKFDLSGLPTGTTGAQVLKATVKLYVTTVALPGNFDVCLVNSTWSEKTLVYSSRPTLVSPALFLTTVPVSTASKYVIFDITAGVQAWLGGSNFGIALLPSASAPCTWSTTPSSVSVVFDSKESTTTSHDAGLNIILAPTPAQIPNLSGSYVDLSTNQTIGGAKTFTSTIVGTTTGAVHANSADNATNATELNSLPSTAFAQLGLSNTFGLGMKQIFQAGSTYAGLNIAGSGDPSAPAAGDVWFKLSDHHLHFYDDQGNPRTLAFITDTSGVTSLTGTLNQINVSSSTGAVTLSLPSTVAVNISGTATSITGNIFETQVTGLTTDLANTLSSAQTFATTAANTAQTNAEGFAATAAAAAAAGAVTTAEGYSAAQLGTAVGTINSSLTGKASLAGGNLFTGGKQTLADAVGAYASLNVPNSATAPTTPVAGDVWLLNTDPHLQFQDKNNATQTLAFSTDVTAANSSTLSTAESFATTAASTAQSNAETFASNAASTAQTNAEGFATTAAAAAAAGAVTTAEGYSDTQLTTAVSTINTSVAGKASLAGGNLFTGGKQTLADAVAGYASLNVPNSTTAPTTPVAGDVWLLNTDPHLQFKDMNNATQMLAFSTDVTAANSSTLSTAETFATNAANTAQSNAEGFATSAAALAAAGAVTTAEGYSDAQIGTAVSTINTSLAGKASLAGGNLFMGGKQTLAGAVAGYASLNVPNSSAAPSAPVAGDVWLLNTDPHLQFKDMNNATQMLAFSTDVTAANSSTLSTAETFATTAASTAQTNAETFATNAANTAQSNAEGFATTAAGTAAAGAVITAEGYSDTQLTTAVSTINTSVAGKASLAGGNLFTGGKQTLADAVGAYASLNVPNSATAPTTPVAGDVWLLNTDPHLQFQDKNNATQTLAFSTDVTAANSSTLSTAESFATTAASTAQSNAETFASNAASTAQTNAEGFATTAAAAAAAGAVTTAEGYSDTQLTTAVSTINTSVAGKASLAGGNLFTGGKQTLADAVAGYASLNVPNSTTAPTTPVAGDVWLLNTDPHLQFKDMNNATQMLAFSTDVTAANSSTLSTAETFATNAANTAQSNAEGFATTAAAAAAAGAVTTAEGYSDTQLGTAVSTINTSVAGKASLAGGNSFTGVQALAPLSGGGPQASNLLRLNSTNGTTPQSAQLQARTDGGLSFQFGPMSGSITEKLSIDNTGKFTFAAGQTFPGVGTVTSITAGTGLSGGTITTSGTINLVAATGAILGGVIAPPCAAGNHYSSITSGSLTCTTDTTTTSLSFSAITPGTNATPLTIGNGGSLNVSGTGTINATSLSGELAATSATAGTIAARDASGNLTATQFSGSGAGLTNVPTSSLTGAPVRVTATTTSTASPSTGTTATATASCASGRVLLGGGAQVTNTQAPDMAVMSQSFPSSTSPGQWTVVGVVIKNMNGGNTMTVTAYALCSGS